MEISEDLLADTLDALTAAQERIKVLEGALKAAEKSEADLIMEWADFWDVAPQALIDSLMHAQTLRNAALKEPPCS